MYIAEQLRAILFEKFSKSSSPSDLSEQCCSFHLIWCNSFPSGYVKLQNYSFQLCFSNLDHLYMGYLLFILQMLLLTHKTLKKNKKERKKGSSFLFFHPVISCQSFGTQARSGFMAHSRVHVLLSGSKAPLHQQGMCQGFQLYVNEIFNMLLQQVE